jgi:hypothetical protein
VGQTVGSTFTATPTAKPVVPARTDMWDGAGMKALGRLTRQWFLFFQTLAQGVSKYGTSWTLQTTVTVSHGLNTTDVGWFVYNASGLATVPQSVTVNNSSTITITFASAFSGRVVVFG